MKLITGLTVILFLVILFLSSVYAEEELLTERLERTEVLLIKELDKPKEGHYFVWFICPKCKRQVPVSVKYGETPNDLYDVICPFCGRSVALTISDGISEIGLLKKAVQALEKMAK